MKGSKRKIKWNWEVLFPPSIGDQARQFIESLLLVDPLQRATLPECKSHPFLTDYRVSDNSWE
jgi:serine/threonine protein kinase